jgi:hypothetical protein
MFSFISKLMDRIFVVVGALVFLQLPLFIQQYKLQLLGHVNELKFQVGIMQKAAAGSDKNLEQFIDKFIKSGDVDFARQGEIMSAMVARFRELSDGLNALNHATVLTKPWVFLTHFNYSIAQSAMNNFEPGILFTFEGLFYGLFGILAGYLCYCLSCRICGLLSRLFRYS